MNCTFVSQNDSAMQQAMRTFASRLGVGLLCPLTILILNYAYLLVRLCIARIWEQRPFYVVFIVLGISDILILLRHLIVLSLMGILQVEIIPCGPKFMQWLESLIEECYWVSHIFSSYMMGFIALGRTVMTLNPNKHFTNPAIIKVVTKIIIVSMVCTTIPQVIGHWKFTTIVYINPATLQTYLINNRPYDPYDPTLIYDTLFYTVIPTLSSSLFPLICYPIIAHRLRKISKNLDLTQNSIRQRFVREKRLCYIGIYLFLANFLIAIFWMTAFMDNLPGVSQLVVAYIAEIFLFSVNPFIYWIIDKEMRAIAPPPWKICVSSSQVTPFN